MKYVMGMFACLAIACAIGAVSVDKAQASDADREMAGDAPTISQRAPLEPLTAQSSPPRGNREQETPVSERSPLAQLPGTHAGAPTQQQTGPLVPPSSPQGTQEGRGPLTTPPLSPQGTQVARGPLIQPTQGGQPAECSPLEQVPPQQLAQAKVGERGPLDQLRGAQQPQANPVINERGAQVVLQGAHQPAPSSHTIQIQGIDRGSNQRVVWNSAAVTERNGYPTTCDIVDASNQVGKTQLSDDTSQRLRELLGR